VTIKRWSAKRDKNERQIVEALRSIGCEVERMDAVDLLVLYQGQVLLLEVKSPTGRLTKTQNLMLERGWPIRVVGCVDEALKAVMDRPSPAPVDQADILRGLG
jgi:AmiR/NasT family two-component response regulator